MGVNNVSSSSEGNNKNQEEIKIKRNKEFDSALLNAFDKDGDGYLRGEEITSFNTIWSDGFKNIDNKTAQAIAYRNTGAKQADIEKDVDFARFNKSYAIGTEKTVGLDVLDNAEIDEVIKTVKAFTKAEMDKSALEAGKTIANILTGVAPKQKDEHKKALELFDTNGDGVLSDGEIKLYNEWANPKTKNKRQKALLAEAEQKKAAATGISLKNIDGNWNDTKIKELSTQYGLTPEAIKKAAGEGENEDKFLSKAEIEKLVNDVTAKLEGAKHKDKLGGFVAATKGNTPTDIVSKTTTANGSIVTKQSDGTATEVSADGSTVTRTDNSGNVKKATVVTNDDNSTTTTLEDLGKDNNLKERVVTEKDKDDKETKKTTTTFAENGTTPTKIATKEGNKTVTLEGTDLSNTANWTTKTVDDGTTETKYEVVADPVDSSKQVIKKTVGKDVTWYSVDDKDKLDTAAALDRDADGNVKTPETSPAGNGATANAGVYYVRNGESLSAIATKLGCTVEELKAANPDSVKTFKRNNGNGTIEGFLVNAKINIPEKAINAKANDQSGATPDKLKQQQQEEVAKYKEAKAKVDAAKTKKTTSSTTGATSTTATKAQTTASTLATKTPTQATKTPTPDATKDDFEKTNGRKPYSQEDVLNRIFSDGNGVSPMPKDAAYSSFISLDNDFEYYVKQKDAEFIAKALRKAVVGAGTNEAIFETVITTIDKLTLSEEEKNNLIEAIKDKFKSISNGKTLSDWIKSDFSGKEETKYLNYFYPNRN